MSSRSQELADACGLTMADARDDDGAAHERLRYVPCEHCHGTGEIIWRDGEYRSGWPEPAEHSMLCSACEGYGRECVETEPVTISDLADTH